MHIRCLSYVFSLALLAPMWGLCQKQHNPFQLNRIQYKEFTWQTIESSNFDVCYYGNQYTLAKESALFLEEKFTKITSTLGTSPYVKTKIFIYHSPTDLQQSNIGLKTSDQFSWSGKTNFIRPHIEVANTGHMEEFKNQLIFKLTHLLITQMMYGGSLKDVFQNSISLNLPNWFIAGASHYVAKGWTSEMDNYVRQLLKVSSARRALRLTGYSSALVGQSLWHYIAENYGSSNINSILNYTRIVRNEKKSIEITLGIPFRQLIKNWKAHYVKAAEDINQHYIYPQDSCRFISLNRPNVAFTKVTLSPDGKYIAYAENDRGKSTVYIKSTEGGQVRKILTTGVRVIQQSWAYQYPLISWSNESTLGIIGPHKGKIYFWLFELKTKSVISRELRAFNNIQNFSFSTNGQLVILSADSKGQNDLYLMSTRRNLIKRLTNDSFDDLDPVFRPKKNRIVFSSNRTTDSLHTGKKPLKKIPSQFNLYEYNLDSSQAVARPLTQTLSRDFRPVALDGSTVMYLSDQRGIVNLFKYQHTTKIYSQITHFNTDIIDFDFNPTTSQLTLVMKKKLNDQIFYYPSFSYPQIFTPPTQQKEKQQLSYMLSKKEKAKPPVLSVRDLIDLQKKSKQDTIDQNPSTKKSVVKEDSVVTQKETKPISSSEPINTKNYTFDDDSLSSSTLEELSNEEKNPDDEPLSPPIQTDDYTFDDQPRVPTQPGDSFLERFQKAKAIHPIQGPTPYHPLFSSNQLYSSLAVDPIRNLCQHFELKMTDELENYQLTGALLFSLSDLKSGDIYGEFQYLPLRMDYGIRFDRRVYLSPLSDKNEEYDEKYTYQQLTFSASYPISVRTRVEVNPFASFTRFTDLGLTSPTSGVQALRPSNTQFYTGVRTELVYDNSITTGLNIVEGTRGKISFTHYQNLSNSSKGFTQLQGDLRHYQKIYKQITFAFRGFVGSFFGPSPKNYLLGGVSTAWRPSFNYSGQGNPLVTQPGTYNEQILFAQFVSNLRGFNYATLYGNNVLLTNIEFRIPLIRALSSGPISSNFFRNLQFLAFYDVGTSWTGALPFNSDKSVRTRVVPENTTTSPFLIEINEFSSPWLYSYGVGIRTSILGHFMWINMAYPYENNVRKKKPVFSFGIGLDF